MHSVFIYSPSSSSSSSSSFSSFYSSACPAPTVALLTRCVRPICVTQWPLGMYLARAGINIERDSATPVIVAPQTTQRAKL